VGAAAVGSDRESEASDAKACAWIASVAADVVVHFLHHGINAAGEAWPKGASAEEMAHLVVALMWGGLESFSERVKRS
jgi:hypothetical protein